MLTNNIAAPAPRLLRQCAFWLGLGMLPVILAGCETGSLLGGGPTASNAIAPAALQQQRPKIAFAQIIGTPTEISSKMSLSLMSASERQNILVVRSPGELSDYTVRGYVVAAPEKAGAKVSYIWDIIDKSGQRAHRISGEEIIKGKKPKDPWSLVDQAAIDGIANKTITQLAAFMPQSSALLVASSKGSQQVVEQKIAVDKKIGAAQSGGLVPNAEPVNIGSDANGNVKSAALPAGALATMVPAVDGAPGDGQQALSRALQRQLSSNGVKVTDQAGPGTYFVKGKVLLGSPANGKQSIKIEWQVLDPAGKRAGTVSQNNVIPQGSLDGAWGKTADAAAAAAAQGIIKLLPQQTRVN